MANNPISPVFFPGPSFATDLQSIPGSTVAVDFGTNDTLPFGLNLTSMTVTIHGGNDTVFTGIGNDTIFDDPGAPVMPNGSHSSGDDVIRAGGGTDTIFAGDGHNTYDGGDNVDTVNYSRSTVRVVVDLDAGTGSGNGTDTLISIENVVGSTNDDMIFGSTVDNVLRGGDGNDFLDGGDGRDILYGGADNDMLVGGANADTMYGEDGIDTISYSTSSAGVTVDLAHGTGKGGDAEGDAFKGVENVNGSRYSDLLIGDGGDNVLFGGQGQDVLIGGAGHDVFSFGRFGFAGPTDSLPANPDLIKDFTQGEDLIGLTRLQLHGPGPAEHLSLVDGFTGARGEVMVDVLSGSTMIYADLNGDKVADFALELSNPVHLTASDFLL